VINKVILEGGSEEVAVIKEETDRKKKTVLSLLQVICKVKGLSAFYDI
jgi:hypothetical protein